MAKKAMIEREKKRARLVSRYAAKRAPEPNGIEKDGFRYTHLELMLIMRILKRRQLMVLLE